MSKIWLWQVICKQQVTTCKTAVWGKDQTVYPAQRGTSAAWTDLMATVATQEKTWHDITSHAWAEERLETVIVHQATLTQFDSSVQKD